jgi:dephospho-CoA kinase
MILGLTGGIAAGKTKSASFFKSCGAYIADADCISREFAQKGSPELKKILRIFGKDFLLSDGTLNRKKLGELVFSDDNARTKLEKILMPKIINRIKEIISERKTERLLVIDAPLLFETNLNKLCDKTAVVSANAGTQIKRLQKRDNLTVEQIKQRISSQMPLKEKLKLADFIIDNNGTEKELENKIKELYAALTKE